MRVVVTGAHGLLGTEFVQEAGARGYSVVALGRTDMDVTDPDEVQRVLGEALGAGSGGEGRGEPWVVHCAAYTAVDRAEEEPEQAFSVNRDGAANVARSAAENGARVVYISTDYVYDGSASKAGEVGALRPWRPADPTGPRSVYARSKLAGEEAVVDVATAHGTEPLVVRTGWLYGVHGRNFVRAILDRVEAGGALRVVEDQRGRPTWARNVAATVLDLMERGAGGVWHVADGGDASWLEFAREALRLRGLDVPVEGVSTEAWGAAAPRPSYSVLALRDTEATLGREMMPWRTALEMYLTEERMTTESPTAAPSGTGPAAPGREE